MKTENIEESIQVPLDMMLDVLIIIVREGLKHQISHVIPVRSLITIDLTYNKNDVRTGEAINNIQELLKDYRHYRSWEDADVNWREE